MFSQRNYSILIITFDCVARVDLRRGAAVEVVRSARVSRSEQSELGAAVRTGAAMGPAKWGPFYILTDELWSGDVSLADEVAGAVTQEQLEQSLAFEAEYTSGISPFESRLGYATTRSADGQSTWRVTQAETAQIDAVMDAMPAKGAPLAALSSISSAIPGRDVDEQPPVETATTEACAEFAQAWLTQHLTAAHRQPVISVARRPLTPSQYQKIGVTISGLVLIICVVSHYLGGERLSRADLHRVELNERETRLRQQIDAGEASARQALEFARQQATEEAALAIRRDDIRRRSAEQLAARTRPVQLLSAVSATAAPEHWVQGIELHDRQATVTGISIDSAAAASLAQRLEAALDRSIWTVQGAEISVADSADVVRFKMLMVPSGSAARRLDVAGSGPNDAR